MPARASRIGVEGHDSLDDVRECGVGRDAALQPIQDYPVVDIQHVAIGQSLRRGQPRVAFAGEGHQPEVEFEHAAAAAPQHAVEVAWIVHGRNDARIRYTKPMARDEIHFKHLDFRGPDAAAFLQGYLTADLDQLAPGHALPMALCNIKGRVVASGWAFGEPSRVGLLVHASVADDVRRELGKYLLFAKSKLMPADAGLRFAAQPLPGAVAIPGVGYWVDVNGEADENHVAFAERCIEAGFVVVAASVSQAFLPQMIGLTDFGAVSFAKGCYLGQEVVARAEHRGQVKQKMHRYRTDGDLPTVGENVLDGERKIGTVVAAGASGVLAATRRDVANARAGSCLLTP